MRHCAQNAHPANGRLLSCCIYWTCFQNIRSHPATGKGTSLALSLSARKEDNPDGLQLWRTRGGSGKVGRLDVRIPEPLGDKCDLLSIQSMMLLSSPPPPNKNPMLKNNTVMKHTIFICRVIRMHKRSTLAPSVICLIKRSLLNMEPPWEINSGFLLWKQLASLC